MLAFNTEAGKLTDALNVNIKYFIMSLSGTSILQTRYIGEYVYRSGFERVKLNIEIRY